MLGTQNVALFCADLDLPMVHIPPRVCSMG